MIQEIILTKDECKSIIDLCNQNHFERSKILDVEDVIQLTDERTSYEYDLEVNDYIENLLLPKLQPFNVKSLPDYLKVIRYEIGQEFKYHTDNGGIYNYRKKSVSIQLSEDYTGGEMNVWYRDGDVLFNKTIGNMIMFDSDLPHQIFPIRSGVRYSLVFWLSKENLN